MRIRRPSTTAADPYRIGPAVAGTAVHWHECGITRESAGDYAAAAEAYRQALRVGGTTPQVAFDLAHALAELGNTAAAIERYWQVIELDDARADAWLNLAELLLADGQYAAGVEALQHAARLAPDDADIRFNLADTLDAAGRADAEPHWRAFLALGGSAERCHYARERLFSFAPA